MNSVGRRLFLSPLVAFPLVALFLWKNGDCGMHNALTATILSVSLEESARKNSLTSPWDTLRLSRKSKKCSVLHSRTSFRVQENRGFCFWRCPKRGVPSRIYPLRLVLIYSTVWNIRQTQRQIPELLYLQLHQQIFRFACAATWARTPGSRLLLDLTPGKCFKHPIEWQRQNSFHHSWYTESFFFLYSLCTELYLLTLATFMSSCKTLFKDVFIIHAQKVDSSLC